MSETVSAPLTNQQLALIGLYASKVQAPFIAEFFRGVVRTVAGDSIPDDHVVIDACEHMLQTTPLIETSKARKARLRAQKRAMSRSNLPPSAMEERIKRPRRGPRASKSSDAFSAHPRVASSVPTTA